MWDPRSRCRSRGPTSSTPVSTDGPHWTGDWPNWASLLRARSFSETVCHHDHMSGFVEAQASQADLAAIAAVLSLACILGALFARTRAPAVSIGLVTALTIGVITFLVSSHTGPHGVPLLVLMSASVGLAGSGLLAVLMLPSHTPARSLRRAAAVFLASAPLIGLVALLSIQHACPLYVMRGSGFCHYDEDVLGGWTAAAAVIIGLDMLLIALLLWITAKRSAHSDIGSGEHSGILVGHPG